MKTLCILLLALLTASVAIADTASVGVHSHPSLRLNSYNSWGMTSAEDHQKADKLQAALVLLARHDNVVLVDNESFSKETPGWDGVDPSSVKRLKPSANVYMYYAGMKCTYETDWLVRESRMPTMLDIRCPLKWYEIQQNGWWLLDQNGKHMGPDPEHHAFDLGKPGVKEAFLEAVKSRLAGKPVTGVVFDYLPPSLSSDWFKAGTRSRDYPTDADWYSKAYVPFVTYVFDGLHKAGYKLAGGCVDYSARNQPEVAFIRSKIDTNIYEAWILTWEGGWRPQGEVAQRIQDFNQDPLECWVGDFGLRKGISDYDRKQNAALAMYYVSIPQSQEKRSYHHYGQLVWDAEWDLDIGVPSEPATKSPDSYFWSRKFTKGIVLFNYEDTKSASYTLSGQYRDTGGKVYSGVISVAPKTGLILAESK